MTALQAAILTGVSIAVALIVGYWIWTVVVGSIRTERLTLTIPSARFTNHLENEGLGDTNFATLNGQGWVVTLTITNNGPSATTITDIRINGVSIADYDNGEVEVLIQVGDNNPVQWTPEQQNEVHIDAGQQASVAIGLSNAQFNAGQTVEITFITAANQVYTSSVALP